MTASIALQIMAIMLFLTGLFLWWDSPSGTPRGTKGCGIKGCRWHPGNDR